MFEWIQDYSTLAYSSKQERMKFDEDSRFEMKRIMTEDPTGMSALGQYFTAASVWLSVEFTVAIPVLDEEVRERIMQEVAPHFAEVKQVVRKGRIETVYLRQLKPGSVKLFDENKAGILPVMKDLYRHHEVGDRYAGRKRSLVHYNVKTAVLEPYRESESVELQALLHTAYFGAEVTEFGLLPLGWQFDDSLKHSVALRFLAGFAPSLTITVDRDTNEVIMLHMSQEELIHKLNLKSAQPQPPRRMGDHLYLDIGHGLVYVVNLRGQPPVKDRKGFQDAEVYFWAEGSEFTDFNHETAERIPEGRGLFIDEDSLQGMIDAVNRELQV
ncbi:hypothetical protein [Paenibacillus ihuae]|uniref:hypothetical protein n=1 Tax=Paenibacillus ihuae TaxID=1232431 RepID=UPI0006D53EBF|nr:hypothetical protein [Paenibacillus ihuae]